MDNYTSHSGGLDKAKLAPGSEGRFYSDGGRKSQRKSIWSSKRTSQDPAAGIFDELTKFVEDKKHQEKVNKNVREVCLE